MPPLQPVVKLMPTSQAMLRDSNLPFGMVVTPLDSDDTSDDSDDDHIHDDQAQRQSSLPQPLLSLLTHVPKCLRCGAPHCHASTHVRLGRTQLLCRLCGQTSSTIAQDQREARPNEGGGIETGAIMSEAATTTTTTFDGKRGTLHGEHENNNNNNNEFSSSRTFCLPLRIPSSNNNNDSRSASSLPLPLYSVPARHCPLLWYIVLDGSCALRLYWTSVSQTLQKLLVEAPMHVHVALLVTTATIIREDNNSDVDPLLSTTMTTNSTSSLGIFALQSPVPFLQTFHDNVNDEYDYDLWQHLLLAAVPMDGSHVSHVQAAIRSLLDVPMTTTATNTTSKSHLVDEYQPQQQPACGEVVQLILSALQTCGQSAGQALRDDNGSTLNGGGSGAAVTVQPHHRLPYAGVKITFLLTQRPAGVMASTTLTTYDGRSTPTTTTTGGQFGGGVGGKIGGHALGQRFARRQTLTEKKNGDGGSGVDDADDDDVEMGRLRSVSRNSATAAPIDDNNNSNISHDDTIIKYYADLGRQCARAAVGVDVLLLVSYDDGNENIPDFGVAQWNGLCLKSGAPGPIFIEYQRDPDRLLAELRARTPWQANTIFGAELRIRLSPGLCLDEDDGEEAKHASPATALYLESGAMGPGSAVPNATQLFGMGVCDAFTSLTLDLALSQRELAKHVFVSDVGPIPAIPVVQTCLAYTAVVRDGASSSYHTVRRLRVCSRQIPLAASVEQLYASLDVEALAVVLFHKLALAHLQDDDESHEATQRMAQDWLQSLLVCVYKSAEVQAELDENEYWQQKGMESDVADYFFANERLLDREGDLSASDVLLGQGHVKVGPLPLLVYLLLQTDVFRLPHVSLDLRMAALGQMVGMTPSVLTRCIAPRLQLWAAATSTTATARATAANSTIEDEAIESVLPLRAEAIQLAVLEFGTKKSPLLLFLDAPDELWVLDARFVVDNNASRHRELVLRMSPHLETALQEAAASYRTPPRMVQLLDTHQAPTAGAETLERLSDILIEDAPLGPYENCAAWKHAMAERVQSELE